MSKGISKIGRTFDRVLKKTGVKKLYDKVVPSGVRRAVSKTWQKVRKPLITAAALYLTAGLGMAAYGAATGASAGFAGSMSYGFGSVNTALGIGSGATTTATPTTTVTGTSGSGVMPAGAANVTGTSSSAAMSGSTFGPPIPSAAGSAAGSATGSAATAAPQGLLGKAGAVAKSAGAATKDFLGTTGGGLLGASVLQGYSAKKAQDREDDLRKDQSWWGMDGHGNTAPDSGLFAGIQPPQLQQSTTLDDLIRRRRQEMG